MTTEAPPPSASAPRPSSPAAILPSVEESRVLLAAAQGRRKVDVVLDSADPRLFVQRLPPPDLYFAIRDVGMEDALELVALASPLQYRALLDLDVWDGDVPSDARTLEWLRASHLAADGDVQSFRAQRAALDPELLLGLYKHHLRFHPLEENDDPVIESDNFVRTAENKAVVEITSEDPDEGAMVRRLVEDLIDANPFEATRFFESVRWEMESELQESALRWREGRLRDLGFPSRDEAMRVWSPLPLQWRPGAGIPLAPEELANAAPLLMRVADTSGSLLQRALERLDPTSSARVGEQLAYLLHCVAAALGVSPRDLPDQKPAFADARDLLSLGLELASDGSLDRAAEALATTPTIDLYRWGFTHARRQARLALDAARKLALLGGPLLDPDEAGWVSGFKHIPPRWYEAPVAGVTRREQPRWRSPSHKADLQAPGSVARRLTLSERALRRLGMEDDALGALAARAGRSPAAVTASQLILTALARHLLGLESGVAPLDPEQARVVGSFVDEGRLSDRTQERARDWFAALWGALDADETTEATALQTAWMERWTDELAPLADLGDVDVSQLETILVQAGVPSPTVP